MARLRFALWRGTAAELDKIRSEWERFPNRVDRRLVDLMFSSLIDGAWGRCREEVTATVLEASDLNFRRAAFLAQICAETAGHVGDTETCLTMLARAVRLQLFDLHWFERCPTIAVARNTTEGHRLHAIVRQRAHAILDELYCDRDGASGDTIATT